MLARAAISVSFCRVLGLTHGELFLVTFITVAVVTARYWPLLGERVALWLSGQRSDGPPTSGPPAS